MKKLSFLFIILLAVLAGSLLFVGCGGKEEAEAEAEEQAEVAEEAEEQASEFEGLLDVDYSQWSIGTSGGTLVRALLGEPKTFNRVTAAETSTTDIVNLVYEYALDRNQMTLEWEPRLAERWEISEDQKTITVYLKEDTLWSDGEPLTAEDFVWTVNELYLNPEVETNVRSGLMVGGEPSVWELVDEYTFKVTLPEVYAGIFNLVAVYPMPKHIMEPVLESEGPAGINSMWGLDADVTAIVGNGPYTVKEYIPSQRVILEKNSNFHMTDEEGNQLPYLDEIVFEIITDQDTQLARFLAGDLDRLSIRGEDYAVLVDKQDELDFNLMNVGASMASLFVTFNQNPIDGPDDNGIEPPELTWLSNLKFRQAIAHLIDRETIINNVHFGFGYPLYTGVPEISPLYWEEAEENAIKYDPERAQELLDEIDYIDRDGDGFREDPEGNRISLEMSTNAGNTIREAVGNLIAQEAEKVGLEINFQPKDFNALVTQLVSSFDWNLIIIGLTAGDVDPISGSNVYTSSGNLHMIEPSQESPRRDWEKKIDELWAYANNTTDEAQRKDGWTQIQQVWTENLPMAYITTPATMHAIKKQFKNYKPYPLRAFGINACLHRMYIEE